MVNRIWPNAVAGEADSVSSVSASACHKGGPNSVNHGQILLVYGTYSAIFFAEKKRLLMYRLGHIVGLSLSISRTPEILLLELRTQAHQIYDEVAEVTLFNSVVN